MKEKSQIQLMFKKSGIVELNLKNLLVVKGGGQDTGGIDTVTDTVTGTDGGDNGGGGSNTQSKD